MYTKVTQIYHVACILTCGILLLTACNNQSSSIDDKESVTENISIDLDAIYQEGYNTGYQDALDKKAFNNSCAYTDDAEEFYAEGYKDGYKKGRQKLEAMEDADRKTAHEIWSLGYSGYIHNYDFKVSNATVIWQFSEQSSSYKQENGTLKEIRTAPTNQRSGSFHCNSQLDAKIILLECKGIAYRNIAHAIIWDVVEKSKPCGQLYYDNIKKALKSSVDCFWQVREHCPNAYNRVAREYSDLLYAEEQGTIAFEEQLALLSYAIGEHPLKVEDLYNYDF